MWFTHQQRRSAVQRAEPARRHHADQRGPVALRRHRRQAARPVLDRHASTRSAPRTPSTTTSGTTSSCPALCNAQTLFLDGQIVGTRSGVINNSAFNHSSSVPPTRSPRRICRRGAPPRSGRSPAPSTRSPSTSTHSAYPRYRAHFRARTAAASMAKTVLPSGKTAAEMRYDTGRDRLLEYTDRNGGTWKLGAPGGHRHAGRTSSAPCRSSIPAAERHYYDYDPVRGRILRYLAPIAETRPEDQPPPDESIPTPPPFECPPPEEDPFCEIPIGGGEGSFPPVELQGARTFTYDDNGFQNTITDELGKSVTLTPRRTRQRRPRGRPAAPAGPARPPTSSTHRSARTSPIPAWTR